MFISWRQDGHSSWTSHVMQGQGLVSCRLDMESWTVGSDWEAMGVAAGTVRTGCALPLNPAHLGLIKMTPIRTNHKGSAWWCEGTTLLGCESPAVVHLRPVNPTPVRASQQMEEMEPRGMEPAAASAAASNASPEPRAPTSASAAESGTKVLLSALFVHTARRNFLSRLALEMAHANNLNTEFGS